MSRNQSTPHKNVPVSRDSVPWVVAADQHRARFFKAGVADSRLQEVDDLLNPAGRAQDRELVSDRPGRLGRSMTHQAVAEPTSAHEHAAEVFAQKVCRRLAKARTNGELGKLYMIAEPDFLGLLRQNLDPPTQALVAGEINKAVTQQGADELRGMLPKRL